MATEVKTLIKDTWVKVLTNVTYSGQVNILGTDPTPTDYLVALVNTGDSAPSASFDGGVSFSESFSPANSVASDYYIMALDADGKVSIFT